jgi:hypothetical protein
MQGTRAMRKAKSLLRWVGMSTAFAGLLAFGFKVQGVEKAVAEAGDINSISENLRADIIVIDGLRAFGKLDRPEVIFLHDAHTQALKKKDKDCKTCHLVEKNRPAGAQQDALSFRFKRLEDAGRDQMMEIYHAECIACHKETARAGDKSGPVEKCGQCHRKKVPYLANRQPIVMDKSLHYRHVEATKDEAGEEKCGLCHHEYDDIAKKIHYVKDKEGSCRYCHKSEPGKTEKDRMPLREALHLSCVNCHRKAIAEKKDPDQKIGAVTCVGCHDLEEQEKIKKIPDVPRLKRKQPDYVLLQGAKKNVSEAKKEDEATGVAPVAFNHVAHEGYQETCRSCHHADLTSCTEACHTPEGVKDGNYIQLAQAAHDLRSNHSCMGCHGIQQKKKECSGCHATMFRSFNQETAACRTCHIKLPENLMVEQAKLESVAKQLVDSRKYTKTTYAKEDIPEKVVIKVLADQYEPAEFPHRKIVDTLVKKVETSNLATYFHREKGTLCQGCHHNSPPDKKPPRCRSCHGKPFDAHAVLRPGMKGAYHQQCIGCHQNMGLEKPKSTDCAGCHKEKKKQS